jgi:hypothetical protein
MTNIHERYTMCFSNSRQICIVIYIVNIYFLIVYVENFQFLDLWRVVNLNVLFVAQPIQRKDSKGFVDL